MHRCACAIGTDNHIYRWGSNTYGQLGTQYPGGWVWSPVQAIDPGRAPKQRETEVHGSGVLARAVPLLDAGWAG